jgi:hypothetical protein
VCTFLGETFMPEMLRMDGALRQRDRLLQGTEMVPGECPVSSKYIGGFRGNVPLREIAFMQLSAGRKMRTYGYDPDPLYFSGKERLKFYLHTWPNQMVRLGGWLTVELLQQHFPGWVGRAPGQRMIIEEPYQPINQLEST